MFRTRTKTARSREVFSPVARCMAYIKQPGEGTRRNTKLKYLLAETRTGEHTQGRAEAQRGVEGTFLYQHPAALRGPLRARYTALTQRRWYEGVHGQQTRAHLGNYSEFLQSSCPSQSQVSAKR